MTYLNSGEKVFRKIAPARRSPSFLKYFIVSIFFFILLVGYIFVDFPLSELLMKEHVVLLLTAIAVIWWATGEYRRHNHGVYIITNDRIIIKTGIVSTHIESVSYDLIVNVKTYRSFLDKIFGIGTIVVMTARGGQETNLIGIKNTDDIEALIYRFVQKRPRKR
jgi:membrane protein YdbS with pleckstrin-like domain